MQPGRAPRRERSIPTKASASPVWGVAAIYAARVELTRSYEIVIPPEVRARYDFCETRNAAAVFASTNPTAFNDVLGVLR